MPRNREKSPHTEGNIFPVTEEAVHIGLQTLAEDPTLVTAQEGERMFLENPEVAELVEVMTQQLSSHDQGAYLEGSIWAYLLLRQQAEQQGLKLPTVSNNVVQVFLRDRIEDLGADTTMTKIDNYLRLFTRMKQEEPVLGSAFLELGKYRTSRIMFYGGASEMYLLFKHIADSRDLRKKFEI